MVCSIIDEKAGETINELKQQLEHSLKEKLQNRGNVKR